MKPITFFFQWWQDFSQLLQTIELSISETILCAGTGIIKHFVIADKRSAICIGKWCVVSNTFDDVASSVSDYSNNFLCNIPFVCHLHQALSTCLTYATSSGAGSIFARRAWMTDATADAVTYLSPLMKTVAASNGSNSDLTVDNISHWISERLEINVYSSSKKLLE